MRWESWMDSPLFAGMGRDALCSLLCRLPWTRRHYARGDTVCEAGAGVEALGLVAAGSVYIESCDAWGERSLLGAVEARQIFAEAYACLPGEPLMVRVVAAGDAEVIFLKAEALLREPRLARNLVDGILRVAIFLCYLIAISRMKDIRRLFAYHGAEHKTIFCYEAGLPLTVENARIQPKHHPRCGTSFLFVVIIVAILVHSVLFAIWPMSNVFARIGVQLLALPFVVGITYEFNRYVGGHDNPVTNFLARPGMWMQNFTTNEPDDSMLEVAIEAMKRVIPEEKGKDAW